MKTQTNTTIITYVEINFFRKMKSEQEAKEEGED